MSQTDWSAMPEWARILNEAKEQGKSERDQWAWLTGQHDPKVIQGWDEQRIRMKVIEAWEVIAAIDIAIRREQDERQGLEPMSPQLERRCRELMEPWEEVARLSAAGLGASKMQARAQAMEAHEMVSLARMKLAGAKAMARMAIEEAKASVDEIEGARRARSLIETALIRAHQGIDREMERKGYLIQAESVQRGWERFMEKNEHVAALGNEAAAVWSIGAPRWMKMREWQSAESIGKSLLDPLASVANLWDFDQGFRALSPSQLRAFEKLAQAWKSHPEGASLDKATSMGRWMAALEAEQLNQGLRAPKARGRSEPRV